MDHGRPVEGERYAWLWGFGARLCAERLREPGRGELFASKAEIDAKDDSICRQYGAKAGEPVYIQCRVAQDQRRDAFRRD
jgi:hypothetical protein